MQSLACAVLIANSIFPKENRLLPLRCPENDVDGLKASLTSRAFGLFDESSIRTLKNATNSEVQLAINRVLRQARKDQLVLLYYSGHGQPDEAGRLHLATADTVLEALESTSVPFEQIKRYIEVGSSRQVAVVLDCCYSGAVGTAFMKSNTIGEELRRASDAQGIYVITASTAVQVAQEKEGDRYSVLTKHVIDALTDPTIDADGDGYISMDELYAYVYSRVRDESQQTPEKFSLKMRGDLMIARTGRLLREERKERMRVYLLDLASKGQISNAVLARSLEIVALKASELSRQLKKYDDLLDELQQKKLEVGQFLERWYRMESSPTLTPAESSAIAMSTVSQASVDRRQSAAPLYVLRRTLPKHVGGVTAGTFSPGGGLLVSGSGDGQIRIWDARTGELRSQFRSQKGAVWGVSFSPDGSRIAACGSEGIVSIISIAGDQPSSLTRSSTPLLALTYHPDGRFIALGGIGGAVQLIDNAGKNVIQIDTGHGTVTGLVFDPQGRWLASTGHDAKVKIWDPTTGKLTRVLDGHRHAVLCAVRSSDGDLLISGGRDGTVRLWNTTAWLLRATLRGHKHSVLSLSIHTSGKLIASGGADGTIRFWDTDLLEPVRAVETGHIAVQFVSFSPDGQQLCSGGVDETVRFWQPVQLRRSVTA